MLICWSCSMGHISSSRILLENCPVGTLAILSWQETRLKEPHSFNFLFLSQVHLDHILPISIAHCCGESVLSLPVLKSERSLTYAQSVASNFFRKIFSAWFLGYSLRSCVGSPDVYTPPTSLLHLQRNLHKAYSFIRLWIIRLGGRSLKHGSKPSLPTTLVTLQSPALPEAGIQDVLQA